MEYQLFYDHELDDFMDDHLEHESLYQQKHHHYVEH
jgi:hypothetical protein